MESWKKTFAVIWSGQLASIHSSEVVAYSIIFWMSLETGSGRGAGPRSHRRDAAPVAAGAARRGLRRPLGPQAHDDPRRQLHRPLHAGADGALLARRSPDGHIYILLACRSAGSAFHIPAMQASVPLLAPRIAAHTHRRSQPDHRLAVEHRGSGPSERC